jgi:hypothetical protein
MPFFGVFDFVCDLVSLISFLSEHNRPESYLLRLNIFISMEIFTAIPLPMRKRRTSVEFKPRTRKLTKTKSNSRAPKPVKKCRHKSKSPTAKNR